MRKYLVLLALLPAAAGLAGCGSSGSTLSSTDTSKLKGDDKAAFDAATAQLGSGEDGLADGATEEQKSCVAIGMIKELGAKRVLELSKKDELVMTNPEATKTADVFIGCVDVGALMASGIAEDGDISEKSAKCLGEKIDKKTIRSVLIASFEGKDASNDLPPELISSMLAAMPKCLTAEELKTIGQ